MRSSIAHCTTLCVVAFCVLHSPLVDARPLPNNSVNNATFPIIFLRPAYYLVDGSELPLTYNDRGSGAHDDITVWTPKNVLTSQMPFKPLGSLAVNNFGSASDNLKWQTAWLAAPGTPGSLNVPVDYSLMWDDAGSGAHMDGSVWRPSAPLGYNSVGDLWASGYSKPATDAMYVVNEQCLHQCPETPALIYADHGSGAHLDGSIYTTGVTQIGVRSNDNYGTSRGQGNYNPVDQKVAWNVCLRPECVKTIQINDFTLAGITYDTNVIDPSKSKASQFHHQQLVNNSPGTISSTVTGTKSTSKTVTMSFTETVTTSLTIREKVTIKAGVPNIADVTSETEVTSGFSFQFAASQSSTTTVQDTLTQSIQVGVPPFSNLTVDMIVATQDNVDIPFVAQLYTTAYDWVARSDMPTEQQIIDILTAGGFRGQVLSYNPANRSLLVENNGVLKAAIATSVSVQITCTPLPGHEQHCPKQQLPVTVPSPDGSNAPARTLQAPASAPLRAVGAAEAPAGSVTYTLRLPSKPKSK